MLLLLLLTLELLLVLLLVLMLTGMTSEVLVSYEPFRKRTRSCHFEWYMS